MDWIPGTLGGGTSGPRPRPQTPTPFRLLCSPNPSRCIWALPGRDRRPRREENESSKTAFCMPGLDRGVHRSSYVVQDSGLQRTRELVRLFHLDISGYMVPSRFGTRAAFLQSTRWPNDLNQE